MYVYSISQQYYIMPTVILKQQSVAVAMTLGGNPAPIKVHFQTLYSETNRLT